MLFTRPGRTDDQAMLRRTTSMLSRTATDTDAIQSDISICTVRVHVRKLADDDPSIAAAAARSQIAGLYIFLIELNRSFSIDKCIFLSRPFLVSTFFFLSSTSFSYIVVVVIVASSIQPTHTHFT